MKTITYAQLRTGLMNIDNVALSGRRADTLIATRLRPINANSESNHHKYLYNVEDYKRTRSRLSYISNNYAPIAKIAKRLGFSRTTIRRIINTYPGKIKCVQPPFVAYKSYNIKAVKRYIGIREIAILQHDGNIYVPMLKVRLGEKIGYLINSEKNKRYKNKHYKWIVVFKDEERMSLSQFCEQDGQFITRSSQRLGTFTRHGVATRKEFQFESFLHKKQMENFIDFLIQWVPKNCYTIQVDDTEKIKVTISIRESSFVLSTNVVPYNEISAFIRVFNRLFKAHECMASMQIIPNDNKVKDYKITFRNKQKMIYLTLNSEAHEFYKKEAMLHGETLNNYIARFLEEEFKSGKRDHI